MEVPNLTGGSRLVWLLWVFAGVILAAVVVGWLVRSYEANLAFFPTKGEEATPASFGAPFTPTSVTTSDGARLRVWHLTHERPKARIVYFHGNGGNLSIWCDILVALARRG